jgi:PAS domain S-box-containing protein
MNFPFWCAWYAVGDITVPRLIAQEPVALIVLAASLLAFRTFRERYLLVWILGWAAYLVSGWTLHQAAAPSQLTLALSHAVFVVAVCLFATALLVYTHARKLLLPLLVVSLGLTGYALARALWFPDSLAARVVLEVAYRAVALYAAAQLMRYRRARGEIGPWLLTGSLLFLHLDWRPWMLYLPQGVSPVADSLLGLSMLLIVFDDYRMRISRLAVINALTVSITKAQQHGPILVAALEELKALMGAKAAWFRLLDGNEMVMVQQMGLSHEFLRERSSVSKEDGFEQTFSGGVPLVLKTSESGKDVRSSLKREGFHHCILVPVTGKKSVIGTLVLGSRRRVTYAPEELDFLATTAHQIGLAVENLQLLEQILRSHRQWTNTFDSIQDVVLLHDAEFRVMKANEALLRRLGRAPSDVIGNTCETCLPRNRGQWTGCPYCRGDEGLYEEADPCFGGFSMVSTSSYSEQGKQQKGTIHVVRDVTDRHLAEEKYRMLFQQMQEGVFVATPEGKLLDCNDAFVRMLGHGSHQELMAVNLDTDVYASAGRREAFRREVELHNYVRNFEVSLRKKDGSLLTALESSFATRDGAGKIERYQGFLLDITEKKQAEDEIRRHNRELNALNAMAMIASQSFDLDEILNLSLRQVISLLGAEEGSIYVSDSGENSFRRRADWGHSSWETVRLSEVQFPDGFGELVTRSRTEVITPEYLPHLPTAVKDFICSGGPNAWIWVLLWGTERPVGIMGISREASRKYTSTDENLLVATGRQLATTIEKVRLYEETCRAYEDLRRTQEQLLQSEKMSAVGQLIAGVAHELNNPLTAILGYVQLLESEQLSERAADFVSKLFKQARRTHRIVQNLLSFSRQRKPQRQPVDICKVLDETLALREYDLKASGIAVEREVEPSLPSVTADPHQLEQVFLNIINNAVDAMLEIGKGGKLKARVFVQNGQVHTEIQDSGPGIKEPNRIFDPFYTTKSVGKGTGLGLSICYGIIKEHGGDIAAYNRPEGGAAVEVRLPAAELIAIPEKTLAMPRRELAIAGRMLLVEDEEAVLEFEREVLTGAGAQVVASMSGETEELKAQLLRESFDAIIVNGKMHGGWSIPELHRWLAEKLPGMEKRLLLTFSTVADAETRAFLLENNLPSLVKPFEVADLIAQARLLLQKTHTAVAG